MKTTVIIPNYNGLGLLKACFQSLQEERKEFPANILIVDNGSSDGSREWLLENFQSEELILHDKNTGFCKAVNSGIEAAKTPYVILLNNDTVVKPGFIRFLTEAIEKKENLFSVSAKMLDMKDESKLDNAGDLYTACGWAFARGKGKEEKDIRWNKAVKIFSACGGASIYRKSMVEKLGYFDENHFAYLEDVDIGWRANIHGYENWYEPKACVIHAGSAASGSRYNKFKVNLSSANNIYIIGKNMPLLQIILNLPLIILGFLIKLLFFCIKGMGGTYFKGCLKGFKKSFQQEGRKRKVKFHIKNTKNYCKIQLDLWKNMVLRMIN